MVERRSVGDLMSALEESLVDARAAMKKARTCTCSYPTTGNVVMRRDHACPTHGNSSDYMKGVVRGAKALSDEGQERMKKNKRERQEEGMAEN